MPKPWIVITGATGFLGGQLVAELRREYQIFAFGRRTPQEAGVPEGPGIEWFRVDIGERDRLQEVFAHIRDTGRVELLIHMAAYYDFTGEPNPEYQRTNVEGTRNVLELAEPLGLRQLIYTSSVAACPFPPPGEVVTEATPPTAPFAYAESKRRCEAMLEEYRDRIPASIVRPAAVVSDWCEYPPLDDFLRTWCSRSWNARIIGGRGLSAIPYLHVDDLVSFYLRLVERCDELEPCEVLIASPDGSTDHLSLFAEATRAHFGAPRRPVFVGPGLARPGIRAREILGRFIGRMPFERSWMVDYIDRRLEVDACHTRRRLDWAPNPERQVLRRLEAMVANRRADPEEWELRRTRRRAKWQARIPIIDD
jgi:nucleoside-diphosphate-sugar epimerase